MRQVVDVDPAGGHIGSRKNRHLFIFELLEYFFALGLRHVAVQPLCGIAPLSQPRHQFIHGHLRAAENNPVKFGLDVDDPGQRIELVAVAHLEIDLVGQVRGHLLARNPKHLDIFHVTLRQFHDTRRHRSRKEQDPAIIVRLGQNSLDIVDKPHVQHLVGLIEDQVLQFLEIQGSPAQVIEDTPRRTDHNIDTLAQTPQLLGHRRTAINSRNDQLAVFIEREQLFGHLQRELASRHENQSLHGSLLRGKSLQNGQPECGRLACSGLRLCDNIVMLILIQQDRNGQFLDRGRSFKAFSLDRREGFFPQSQCGKFIQLCHKVFFSAAKTHISPELSGYAALQRDCRRLFLAGRFKIHIQAVLWPADTPTLPLSILPACRSAIPFRTANNGIIHAQLN